MAMALFDKLQLRAGMTGLCLGLPDALRPDFGFVTVPQGLADYGIGFCLNPSEAADRVLVILAALRPGGLIWMVYRKGKLGADVGLTRDKGWEPLWVSGYETVRSISISADWTGLRFRHTAEMR